MARIVVERTHTLGRQAAREKAEQLAAKLVNDYGVRCEWQGDVLAVRRSGADGRIEVGEDRVRVLLNLGLLLSAMGSSVQAQIEHALDKALQARRCRPAPRAQSISLTGEISGSRDLPAAARASR